MANDGFALLRADAILQFGKTAGRKQSNPDRPTPSLRGAGKGKGGSGNRRKGKKAARQEEGEGEEAMEDNEE